jgi:hypothetical protein
MMFIAAEKNEAISERCMDLNRMLCGQLQKGMSNDCREHTSKKNNCREHTYEYL